MAVRKRKRRFQITCRCGAYKFPHRLGGGKCSGSDWAGSCFLFNSDECGTCNCNNNGVCEVATGQESVKECQAVEAAFLSEHDPQLPTTEQEMFERIYCTEEEYQCT
jgi:hypothetical protein